MRTPRSRTPPAAPDASARQRSGIPSAAALEPTGRGPRMGVRLTALLLAAFLAIPGADPVSAQDADGAGASIEVRGAAPRRRSHGVRRAAAPAGRRVGRASAAAGSLFSRGHARWALAGELASRGRRAGRTWGSRGARRRATARRWSHGVRAPGAWCGRAWGERRLPRARFFPADARVGRWLASSPLTVAVPPSGPAGSEGAALPAPGSVALDRAALVALYEVTDGPNWFNSANWLTSSPIGEWHGVTTDRDGRVVGLDLPRNRLTGSIPEELGSLARLAGC